MWSLIAQVDPATLVAMEAAKALTEAQSVQQLQQAIMGGLLAVLIATVTYLIRRERTREDILEARRIEERDWSRSILERTTRALERLDEKEAPK